MKESTKTEFEGDERNKSKNHIPTKRRELLWSY